MQWRKNKTPIRARLDHFLTRLTTKDQRRTTNDQLPPAARRPLTGTINSHTAVPLPALPRAIAGRTHNPNTHTAPSHTAPSATHRFGPLLPDHATKAMAGNGCPIAP